MISANKINTICDSYVTAKKFGNNYVELYVNPSKAEMLKLTQPSLEHNHYREIRFAINPDEKKIYFCDAYVGLHPYMRRMLNLNDDNDQCIIYGEAEYDGSNFIIKNTYSAMFSMVRIVSKVPQYKYDVERFFKFEWSWVKKYYLIGLDDYIKKLRKMYDGK